MQNKYNKRICIVAHGLGGGGLERVAAMQSIYLSDCNYDVFIVTILNKIDYEYKGKLFNLGKYKTNSNSVLNRLRRFLVLKRFIKKNNIDVIIDHRPRTRWLNEWLISNFLYTKPTIYAIHSFKISNYIPTKKSFLNLRYKSSKKIVAVSKAIEKKIREDYGITNVQTIYNPIEIKHSENTVNFEKLFDYILWYGRLDDAIKNLKLLIDAYKISELPNRNYKLMLLGNGPDENKIKKYVSDHNLEESVVFVNHVLNPLEYVKSSKFVVLSSRYEGYPMVLPEALSCGIPVISTDCQSGPNEIINHKINGLLVKNNNKYLLSEAMNAFILDEELYKKCKLNSKSSVNHLDISLIKEQWIKIIEDE